MKCATGKTYVYLQMPRNAPPAKLMHVLNVAKYPAGKTHAFLKCREMPRPQNSRIFANVVKLPTVKIHAYFQLLRNALLAKHAFSARDYDSKRF